MRTSIGGAGGSPDRRAVRFGRCSPTAQNDECRGERPSAQGRSFEREVRWQQRRWSDPFPARTRSRRQPGARAGRTMYPYYARFDEERREADEQRFWFWNSMHFPVPMPAFDAICIDTAYQALGTWQNRVFAVPPAMGIDWRCINGYIYISGNPVTDPAKIAERAEFFQKRAGLLLRELERPLREVAHEDGRADRGARRARGAAAPRVRAGRGRLRRPGDELLRRPRRVPDRAPARRPDVAEPLRVPAARLRRLHDVLRALQGQPAGHPRPAHRADGRRPRRAPLQARRRAAPAGAARDRHRRRRGVRRGPHTAGDRRGAGARATPAARGSPSSSRSRTRGSTWRPATASTTPTAAGSTTRRSRTRR